MTATAVRSPRTGLVLALVLFVLLGLPEGVLGTAWASMRVSLDRPVESLAWLVAGYTLGYFVSTIVAGRTQERIGIGATLAAGVAATGVGLLLYAIGSIWIMVVLASFALGLGAGTVDAALNGYLAVVHGARAMNMLHAMFGVGATGGPLLVTLAISADLSWRWVYAALLVVELLVLAAVVARRDAFEVELPEPDEDAPDRPINWRVLSFMLSFFVLYVMIEASYGQWSYSILTEQRAVGDTAAGWGVASFWGGLTAGRLLLGVVGRRVRPEQLLSASVLGVAFGAFLFWWDPVAGADLVALPLVGLAAAGVFPALVLLTPVWIGPAHTGRAVGYQLAASSAGVITISGLLGVLVGWRDLGVVAPVLFAIALVMVVANALTQRAGAAA